MSDEHDAHFGCYADFYAPGMRYLSLLRLHPQPANIAAVRILKDVSGHADWVGDSVRLLGAPNWRGHLAPLVSYIAARKPDAAIVQALIGCMAAGSWVSPQIIAGIQLSGGDAVRAVMEVHALGIHRAGSDPLRLHVETGPGADVSRMGKLFNSLIGLGLMWGIPLSGRDVNELISLDEDGSDLIARDWHDTLQEILAQV